MTASSTTTILHKSYRPSPPVTADTVLSVDAAPDDGTWVAVRAHCKTGWCIDLAHSSAGSQRFGPLQPTDVPAGSSPVCDKAGCGATQVMFATPSDGYLFDPGLYYTVDDGRHWAQIPGGTVNTLVANRTQVFRGVFGHEGCPGPCDERIQVSAPGRSTWKNLPGPRGLGSATGLVLTSTRSGVLYALGPANLAQGDRVRSQLYRGSDAGRTWSRLGDPCPAGRQIQALAATGMRLVVLCKGESAGSLLANSTDAGHTFGVPHRVPIVNAGLIALSGDETYLATGPLGGEGKVSYSVTRVKDGATEWDQVLTGHEQLNSSMTDNVALTSGPHGEMDFIADPTTLWRSRSGTTWTSIEAAKL